ncbi:MAG: hypothetical protein KDE56_29590, partial [Anaerolineales bacterium]|nr:hypothetical protein [Anaerolineales bacterium]
MMQKAEANKESGKENGRFARKPAEQTATAEPSLQQMLGNRAIGRLTIQRKMTVNAVGDKYEQEADAVAKAVVQTLNAPQPAQRQEVEDEELPATMAQRQMSVMRQAPPPEEEEPLQMKAIQRQEVAPEEEELQLQRQEDEEELQAQRQEVAP